MMILSMRTILAKTSLSMKNIPKILSMTLIPVIVFGLLAFYALSHFSMLDVIEFLYIKKSTPIFFAKVGLAILAVILAFFDLSIQYKLVPIVRGSQERVSFLDIFQIFKHPQFSSIFGTYLIRILHLGLVSLILIAAFCLLFLSPFLILITFFMYAGSADVSLILLVFVLGLTGLALFIFVPFNYTFYLFDMVLYDQLETGTYTNPLKVFKESARLIKGYKKHAFDLDLTLFLWRLATVLTFGIAGIYTIPYIKLSRIHFYQALLEERQQIQENETKI